MENLQRKQNYFPIREKNQKPTRTRHLILILLFFITAINYMDRASLSVVAPTIQKSLDLSPALLGLIFSAFSWSYTAMQVPGGLLLDKFGSKIVYGISLASWSIFTGLQSLASSFALLFGCRLFVGFTESPAFPANSRIVQTWFPRKERAFATGVYTAGEYVGLAFATPFLFWLLSSFGWNSVFYVAGAMGLVFSLFWFKFYQDPNKHKKINQEELAYIQEDKQTPQAKNEPAKLTLKQFLQLFKYRKLVGMYIGQFAITTTLYFFLTWFPTYLAQAKHMTFLHAGFYASVPYIAAFLGVLFGGTWSDWLMRRGLSINIARKLPVILGLLLTSTIILANYTSSIPLVITILSVASFAQGMSNITWAILMEIVPKKRMGIAGGLMNFFANTAGIVTPMVIGFIVAATNSYNGAILFIGLVAIIGALSYIFIVGKINQIEMD